MVGPGRSGPVHCAALCKLSNTLQGSAPARARLSAHGLANCWRICYEALNLCNHMKGASTLHDSRPEQSSEGPLPVHVMCVWGMLHHCMHGWLSPTATSHSSIVLPCMCLQRLSASPSPPWPWLMLWPKG